MIGTVIEFSGGFLMHLRCTLVSLCVVVSAFANESSNPPPARSPADQRWAEIQSLIAPPQGNRFAPTSATDANDRRREIADRFNRAAIAARDFYEKNPEHVRAMDARIVEVRSLLNAAMAGDNSREADASTLVRSLRSNSNVPSKARYEIAALNEIVRLRPLIRNREAFLRSHEESARGLIAEFPGEQGGYEAFLRFAESHPIDAEGVRIANDLLNMPAPEQVKLAAQRILDQRALVGTAVAPLAAAALGQGSVFEGGNLVIYTWATWSPGSRAQIRNVTKLAGESARFVGICLDTDLKQAKALAATESLPGEHLYDARGVAAPIVQALKLSKPMQVYVVDGSGIIREVSAERGDLSSKLAAVKR